MKRLRCFLVAPLLAALMLAGFPVSADARDRENDPPNASISYGRQYGRVLRAKFSEHANGKGYKIYVYGSRRCTASTAKPDISISWLGRHNWNDDISRAYDYNRCDVKLYDHVNFGGAWKGYTHYGYGGRYVGYMNDRTSSFMIS